MTGLIVKSPYIKCGGKNSAAGYLSYIGTRENVEILPDGRPPTLKQEQLIRRLTTDFPDTKQLPEYEDYESKPTKYHASAFITMALETNWDEAQRSEIYMKYIATRPRAERFGSHGLFGDEEQVDLDRAIEELEQYTGNVWTHIISLKREDAERLGYNNAETWRDLIRTHRNDIASAMKIPPQNFRWYAAFHDEGEHPHIHMMAWSVKPGEAYLSKNGIRQIRSELTNTVFHDEMLHLYKEKSQSRDELVREARRELKKLAERMSHSMGEHPDVERLMTELADQLGSVKGKKSYGYLKKPQKELVDQIVDQMARFDLVSDCYDRWLELQGKVDSYYHDKEKPRLPMSRQKELRPIKNAVIKVAERVRLGEVTFEDRDRFRNDEPKEFQDSSYDFDELWDVIRDKELTMEEREGAVSEMEQMAMEGDAYAQYVMGTLYRDGPLLTPDTEKARYWLELAANDRHLAAQYALGKLYLSNDFEVHNSELGMKWMTIAAENGSDYAMYQLGKEYFLGRNTDKDMKKAVECFTQAAEQGNQFAQYILGKLYLDGKDVPPDREQALLWMTRSAEQGNAAAKFFVRRQDSFQPPSVMLAASQLLYHMSRIFQEQSLPKSGPGGIHIDSQRWKELLEARLAAGHSIDDHEDSWPTMSM